MKTILLSLTAAAALAAAVAPAAAQTYGAHPAYPPAYSDDYARRGGDLDRLNWKITRAVQEQRISWREARELRDELRHAQYLADRVQSGRADGWERERLDRTVARIEFALNRYADNDRHDWRR